ncbi:hypothetical protein F5Y19DRAFT_230273 [Xylariaceae sp. FL1651]|nr:hypothetical protein F5Y19DRAFT_230273 [Xylariaceae sp. FL1651]
MAKTQQLTLFLWLEGMFPRRVSYWLFLKGLVSSPADLLDGKTSDPNLSIVRLAINMSAGGWTSNPENDPLPTSNSTPSLRIRDTERGSERWVRESSSIVAYLEEVYADRGPALKSNDLLDIALTNDLIGIVNLSFLEGGMHLRHASPQLAAFSGIKDEDRSRPAARNGYSAMVKGLVKLQSWAKESLDTTGWLTPGTDGPGLVDVNLASGRRYLELGYKWNIFESEELKPLAEWYERFQKLPWWNALEERPNVHPKELQFEREVFEL